MEGIPGQVYQHAMNKEGKKRAAEKQKERSGVDPAKCKI